MQTSNENEKHMAKITRESLLTLEAYAKIRNESSAKIIAHKKQRKIPLGTNITLIFEDESTIRYQIQEMLHVERIFQEQEITHELATYAPLVPDGSNWKATMMIEYTDPIERATRLSAMVGIEDKVWVKIAGHKSVYAIADEDLERETAEKTSSVHFLRFELTREMIQALHQGAVLSMGVEHPAYTVTIEEVEAKYRDSLMNDLTIS